MLPECRNAPKLGVFNTITLASPQHAGAFHPKQLLLETSTPRGVGRRNGGLRVTPVSYPAQRPGFFVRRRAAGSIAHPTPDDEAAVTYGE